MFCFDEMVEKVGVVDIVIEGWNVVLVEFVVFVLVIECFEIEIGCDEMVESIWIGDIVGFGKYVVYICIRW